MAKKKLTAEEKAIKEATAKIEAKYAKLAKERFNVLNQIVAPDVDLLDMSDDDFVRWSLGKLKTANPSAYEEQLKVLQRKRARAEKAKRARDAKRQARDVKPSQPQQVQELKPAQPQRQPQRPQQRQMERLS